MATLLEQQRVIKQKDYRSLVLYSASLNAQSAVCCSLLSTLVVLGVDRVFAALITALQCLVCDIALKVYYFKMYRVSSREVSPGSLKDRKRMWMEGISLAKNFLCLIPVVYFDDQCILAFTQVSSRFLEACHLIVSMVLLVYFVIATYFMISQAFCYHYSVVSSHQYISATHLLIFFQVFTSKVEDLKIWYFAVILSVFVLVSGTNLVGIAFLFTKKPEKNVYRRHIGVMATLLIDTISITLSNAGLQDSLTKKSAGVDITVSIIAVLLAVASLALLKKKLALSAYAALNKNLRY